MIKYWVKISLFFLFLLFVNVLQAQNNNDIDSTIEEEEVKPIKALPDGKFKFGIKLGVHLSTLLGSENTNNTSRFGINGGVYMRQKFKNQKWGYQLELNGALRGSNYNSNATEYSTIRLAYIDMPLLLWFNLSKDENNKILVGPQLSYLLTASIYNSSGILGFDNALGKTFEPKFNAYDVAACVGHQIKLGHISLQTILKYGFININDGLLPNQILKPNNKGKSMNNLVLELNIIF